MNYGRILGFVMGALCFLASISYAVQGDWRRAIYWLLASGINVVVVY